MVNFFRSKKLKLFHLLSGFLFVLIVLLLGNFNQIKEKIEHDEQGIQVSALLDEPIKPIPTKLELNHNKVQLGKKLFHDPQLSKDGTISCATCHDLDRGGVDRLPVSLGVGKNKVPVNSPTVFNSGFQFKQFWNGRVNTLEEQVDGPISTPGEMGGLSWDDVVTRLKQSDKYKSEFKKIYPDGITPDNIRNAIAVFERSLYTPNASFDRYLRGDKDAITAKEKQGYELFKAYGCVTCHQGMLLGGNMFQTFGVMGDYFGDRGKIIKDDFGRYNVTGNERDRHVFKVPTLRNIVLTSPYFHDGSAKNLSQAIKVMGKYQLGVDIPQEDVDLIIEFLKTLTGEYQGKPL